jgi:hypothetical protein
MPVFDHGINTLADFALYLRDTRGQRCDAALDWAFSHTWEDVAEGCPPEFAYRMLLEYLDVLGPNFRAGAVLLLGRDPFWSARAWLAVPGLTDDEYAYLFARAYPRYGDRLVRHVERGGVPAARPVPE